MNNKTRQTLCEIIRDYGRDVARDTKRCKALLLDLCGGEHKREINVLVSAMEERVASDLLNLPPNVPTQIRIPQLVKRLVDDRATAEPAARWAVESWALALGVIQEHDLAGVKEEREKQERERKERERKERKERERKEREERERKEKEERERREREERERREREERERKERERKEREREQQNLEQLKQAYAGQGTIQKDVGSEVMSVAFSPDGQVVAAGSWDQTVRLWRVADGQLVRTLAGHTCFVYSVAFSPDGQVVASGSRDSTVRLWNLRKPANAWQQMEKAWLESNRKEREQEREQREREQREREQREREERERRWRAEGKCEKCGTTLGWWDKVNGKRCKKCR
jgi:hypothetical protein